MRKFILSLVIMMMTVFTVNAQIAIENPKLLDNTYVGVNVGASTPLNFDSMFPVNTVVGIKLGKELTPIFGVEAEGQFFFNENNFNEWTHNFIKGTNVGVNGTINLNNLFAGYKGTPRLFEVKTNTGLGWLHRWGKHNGNALTAKTALDFNFNLGTMKQHTLSVTPGVWWNLNETGEIQFNKQFAQLALFVGYTYHFKTSNGTHHFKTYDVGAMMEEINMLRDELNKKPKEVMVDRVVTNTVTDVVNVTDAYVFFAYDSSELDNRAKEELNKFGQNGVYCVDAWASNEGSIEYNKVLSQRRADAVKAYLESRGCKVDRAEGHGVQFGTTTGRVAIVTVK